jgi:putative NIF3 family GTP cyclohydrolase 1 type 2
VHLQDILDWSARLAGCDSVPADSQVYVESTTDVRRVLFGVDITLAEVLWAQQNGFDAVIAHHPLGGRTRTAFAELVRTRQVEQMTHEGIAHDVAERAIATRLDAIARRTHMMNVNAIVDSARLFGMPLCNVHLACDIITRNALSAMLRRHDRDGATVGDCLRWFDDFSEYQRGHARPQAWVGSVDNVLGRWTVAIAGGTNGGSPVFTEYFRAGVDTIFAMHIDEDDLQRLRAAADADDTLVVTGHMTSDSIGINVVIAGLEERGIEVVRTSGVVAPA